MQTKEIAAHFRKAGLALARRRIPSADAEDVVQEALLRTASGEIRALGGRPLSGSDVPIFVGVCRNHARRFVRSRARRERYEAGFATDADTHTADPEALIAQAEASELVTQALRKLSEEQRTVVDMCDLQEQTTAAVAARLQLPEGTVRSRLFHGRKRLRAALLLLVLVVLALTAWASLGSNPATSSAAPVKRVPTVQAASLPVTETPTFLQKPEPPSTTRPSPHSDANELSAFEAAHQQHFHGTDRAQALASWDAFLRAFPRSKWEPEARFNRALCLVQLGRQTEAREDLTRFARGAYGTYHRNEAARILKKD
jgi:RNA polymerase sigma factor (sigma-70 family)